MMDGTSHVVAQIAPEMVQKTPQDTQSLNTSEQTNLESMQPQSAAPIVKTMLSYFSKLPSKAVVVEELNPRKLAPAFNRQHVANFQRRLEQFDAELAYLTSHHTSNDSDVKITNINVVESNGVYGNISTIALNPSNDKSTSVKNYITDIKTKQHIPFRIEKRPRSQLRAKLLQYHEDVRPPYWGTWQRKSEKITGRRPFAEDEEIFDYEVDSEAEWDIGGPGESLKGDDSEDEEEQDDYEIDMQTFVPHGYVSDDEVEEHSDQEENKSANQSLEEICDEDDSCSVQIVGEKGLMSSENKQRQSNQKQPLPEATTTLPPLKQSKLEIKPITLGLYYENEEPQLLSESKLQFLRTFQGMSCK